jgi:alpha-beta hydrolase superfamily lysophospholipase
LLAVSEARDHPADVAGVVLLAPLFQVSSRRAGGLSPEWLYGVGQQLRVFTTLLENRFPQDAADPAAGSMEARDRFVPITVFEQMFKLVRQARELNQPFSHPVLLVVAPNDRLWIIARLNAGWRGSNPRVQESSRWIARVMWFRWTTAGKPSRKK